MASITRVREIDEVADFGRLVLYSVNDGDFYIAISTLYTSVNEPQQSAAAYATRGGELLTAFDVVEPIDGDDSEQDLIAVLVEHWD